MIDRSRLVPWLFALTSALVQAHGATTSGHLMWLAPVPWALALMLAVAREDRAEAPPNLLGRHSPAALSAAIGLVSSAHLWGVVYYDGWVFLVVLAYHVLVWGAYGALAGALLRRAGRSFALAAGAAWAGLESVRSLGAISFPFFFGGMLADETSIAQIASVCGTAGLSGLLFWVGFAAAGGLATLWGERRWYHPAAAGAPMIVVALGAMWGARRVAHAGNATESLRVGVAQGAIPPWLYSHAAGTGPFRRVVEEHYGFLYRRLLRSEPPPDLVVFPETTFNWRLPATTEAIRRIATLGATPIPPGTTVLFGASFLEGKSNTLEDVSRNAVAIATAGADGLPDLGGVIVKRQLVPFIEMGHDAATSFKVARVGERKFGVMVCYESMYPEPSLFAARHRADLLVLASDDSGMRWSRLLWTHAEQARFRAIEVGLPLVRAGQAGVSYVVDAFGRELGRLDVWESGVVMSDVPLDDLETPFRRWGGAWGIVFWGLALWPLRRKSPSLHSGKQKPTPSGPAAP